MSTCIVWHNDASHETQYWFMKDERIVRRATAVDEAGHAILVGSPWHIVATHDGQIVWHNDTSGETQLWFMKDERIVRRRTAVDEAGNAVFVGLPWRVVASGRGRIVWHNDTSNETQLWFMKDEHIVRRRTSIDEGAHPIFVGPPWRVVGCGPDRIVWHNATSGETQSWVMTEERIVRRKTTVDEAGRAIFVGLPWHIVGADADRITWHNDASGETQCWFMDDDHITRRRTVVDEAGKPILIGPPWRVVGTTGPDRRSHEEATAAIVAHYMRLGGPTGRIGVPMGNVTRIEGGFARPHSAGLIQLLDADIGPQGFHTKEASVRFVGFRCHQQSENGPDEPYFIVGIQGFNPGNDVLRTFGPFEGTEGVRTGDNRFIEQQLTTTATPPFAIHVLAMENDSGSPAEASQAVEKGMRDGTAKLTAALAPIDPATVFAIGGAVQAVLGILGGTLADGISAVLGMGDDFIGQSGMTFFDYDKAKDEWRTPPPLKAPDFDRPFNVELVLDNGEGGRYSAFFQITLFTVDRVPVGA